MPANNTIWIIGDSLLTGASGHYTQFKRKKGDVKDRTATCLDQTLYMETMYVTKMVPTGMYTAQQAKNMPNIILNNLVDTMNLKAKVPHSMIIIINDHRFWNNTDLLTYQMERIITRFFKEIRRIVEARNLSLPPRAVNWDYPRLFITRALPLPNNMTKPYPKGFKANRRRYNRILTRGETNLNYRSINLADFTCENQNNLFAPDGSLTQDGFRSLWRSISDAVHKADNQDRILLNKARAKQLAAQIPVTSSEAKAITTSQNVSDISDIESLDGEVMESTQITYKSKPTKRSLVTDFNRPTQQYTNNQIDDSPTSQVSEYFTVQHRKPWGNQPHHRTPNKARRIIFGGYNNKEPRPKKKNNKSTWRQQPPHGWSHPPY